MKFHINIPIPIFYNPFILSPLSITFTKRLFALYGREEITNQN
jgi:hypothetical protein